MSAYLYQTVAATAGNTYTLSFDYQTDADVAPTSLIYAGLSAVADLVAHTDVNSLPDATTASFAVGPSESGTKTVELIPQDGQTALFLTNILATEVGSITIDNVSLTATLSLTGNGYLENSTMDVLNLATQENQSSFFLYTFLPTGSDFNSVELRIGSSATDYWFLTVYENQAGNAFETGWNRLQFPWASMSTVGSPDSTSIGYARVTWNYNGDLQTGVHLNGLDSILGTVLEYEYYSKYLFRSASTGAFQETVTDDSNLINLDTESYNLLFNLVAALAVQQQQGANATLYDGNYFGGQYKECLERYKAMYKSEVQKPQSTYYYENKPGYTRYLGPRW